MGSHSIITKIQRRPKQQYFKYFKKICYLFSGAWGRESSKRQILVELGALRPETLIFWLGIVEAAFIITASSLCSPRLELGFTTPGSGFFLSSIFFSIASTSYLLNFVLIFPVYLGNRNCYVTKISTSLTFTIAVGGRGDDRPPIWFKTSKIRANSLFIWANSLFIWAHHQLQWRPFFFFFFFLENTLIRTEKPFKFQ